jgi:hypothetical protein
LSATSTGGRMVARGGFRDLKVYRLAYKLATEIFNETKTFLHDERYAMTSQIGDPRAASPRTWRRDIGSASTRICSLAS